MRRVIFPLRQISGDNRMQIRNNLYITYCVLLSITFLCSCCLLFAVAAESRAASLSPQPGNNRNAKKDATFILAVPEPVSRQQDDDQTTSTASSTLSIKNNVVAEIKDTVAATAEMHENVMIPIVEKPQNLERDTVIVTENKNIQGYSGVTVGMIVDTNTVSDTQEMHGHDDNNRQETELHELDTAETNSSLTDIRGLMPDVIVSEVPPHNLEASTTSLKTSPNATANDNIYENANFSSSSTTLDLQNESTQTEQQREHTNVLNNLNDTQTAAILEDINVDKSINSSEEIGAVTAEVKEVPIPVFSEWAQKQMEEQQAMEQKVFNTNSYKKNQTNDGTSKVQTLKIRAKNYASPDCGAKIIASNTDATNTGAVLSSSKDEYMLSPCGNRIWFVVELCEAIQARKIDVANFELFSSSPRNFTVAVSNRFPTRDWSNVGRFIAADKRTIQSFELHPHLFGKFIRVDIHSHYSKEHFCPVSLFRVFGTSEFEAFETENHPTGSDDELDDDFDEDHSENPKRAESNLFKSASDAVLSIVKKAAEVLAKPTITEYNNSLSQQNVNSTRICCTPVFSYFSCSVCTQTLVEQINRILSCDLPELVHLLHIPQVRSDLLNTRVCYEQYGLDISFNDCNIKRKIELDSQHSNFNKDIKHSYYLNLLSEEYIGGLCQLLYADQLRIPQEHNNDVDITPLQDVELNLTIGKKVGTDDTFQLDKKIDDKENLGFPAKLYEHSQLPMENMTTVGNDTSNTLIIEENASADREQGEIPLETTSSSGEEYNYVKDANILPTTEQLSHQTESFEKVTAPDINIFNSPPTTEVHTENEEDEESGSAKEQFTTESTIAVDDLLADSVDTTENDAILDAPNIKAEPEDEDKWTNLDQFLIPTTIAPNNVEDNSVSLDSNNVGNIVDNGGSYSNSNHQHKAFPSTGPQSESVFIRLSNRIKALERNMSLSGQYLEELSRRYKKQVEELQLTLTQQTQTVRLLEEQGRQHIELERLLAQRNSQLKQELDDLTLQVHACIVLIIFVGVFVFIVLMIGILFYRSMRREMKDVIGTLMKRLNNGKQRKSIVAVGDVKHEVNRRKSFEDLSSEQLRYEISALNGKKQRRPSEEAMLILKDCVDTELQVATLKDMAQNKRQQNIPFSHENVPQQNNNNKIITGDKRRNKKYSWPQTAEQRQQQHIMAWRLQQDAQNYNNLFGNEASSTRKSIPQHDLLKQSDGLKKKRKLSNFKRQESAPSKYPAAAIDERLNVSAPVEMLDNMPLLDEEDINNFIPNADLAYNEFMPDGPFNCKLETAVNKNSELSKTRRLTSVIFRAPFSKNLKLKSGTQSTIKITPSHESTSWEWYRLNKNYTHAPSSNLSTKNTKQTLALSPTGEQQADMSPSGSIDSSSLSEIKFPNNSTENSFRMLEEAIISSGENTGLFSATTGTKGLNSSNSHSSGSSNRSSTSSTSVNAPKTKKTYRSFNRIFRKVF